MRACAAWRREWNVDFADRLSRCEAVATRLSSLSDNGIRTLLASVPPPRIGIGGATQTIAIAGHPVFVKTIALSDQEVDAGPGDTRNLFNLPPWYHYGVGVGSAGFNAWREVAAHELVSDWVTRGDSPGFPVLYHWRVIPDITQSRLADDDIVRAVKFWQDSPDIEHRLRALAASTTAVAVFLEYFPHVLGGWLRDEIASGSGEIDGAVNGLVGVAEFMRSRGVVHFDTHLDNVLTTGRDVVVSDFGLLAGADFHLDSDERRMLTTHVDHDVAYCAAALANAILGQSVEFPDARARNDWIRRCADTGDAPGVPDPMADTIRRLAPSATLTNDFYWQLHDGNVQTPFPYPAMASAIAKMDSSRLT